MPVIRNVRVLSVVVIALFIVGANATVRSQAEDRIVTTTHQVVVDGKTLRYTARAGHLPIRDNETGEVHGRMFFVGYTLERGPDEPMRPLTFLWNGGPGSSSSLVHMIGFGPRRLGPDNAPIDNEGTWLGFSDLVFVDPVGTGYSRPVKAEYGPEFYQTRGDAESVAEFIRVYRNRFEAWHAPLFLAGESYGVTRAAGVADVLERRGIRVSGAILIGLALPLGQLTRDQRTALNVPTYTAAAFANKKLGSDLQRDLQSTLREAEAWAATRYAPARARRDSLTEQERKALIAELARFSGFDASLIDPKTIAIPMPQFSEQLLRDQKRVVGRYDSRLTAPFDPEQAKMYDPTKDPSLRNIINNDAVIRYLRSELEYENDLPYQGPFGGGYPPPTTFRGDWMSTRWNRGSTDQQGSAGATQAQAREGPGAAASSESPLERAMKANPALKVLTTCGYYDLVCSYYANAYLVDHLEPELKSRVLARGYGGGHAIYTEDAVRLEMKRDAARFVQSAIQPLFARSARGDRYADAQGVQDARNGPHSGPTTPGDGEAAVTQHQIEVGGRTLRYTARAGLLPIRVNETGEAHAQVFYIAYTLNNPPNRTRRPLTFLWNGGPGANSVLLHLIGFGPKRIKTAHDSPDASCECELQANEATWLEHSDLVFVDPVGTGFSRPTRAAYGAEFYNTLGDIASIAEFVRLYRIPFDAWDAPLFIAGESYGVWRAAGVAEALEQRGQHVAGVMLISGGIPVGPVVDDELRAALFLQTRAAAAFHHKKLASDLQADRQATLRQVEAWARTEYAPALKKVASLSEAERQTIVSQLARFTGLDATLIDRQTLIVGRQAFAEQLLRDQGRVLARFDTRDTGGGATPGPTGRSQTVNRYLRSALQFKTDIAYQGVEQGFSPPTRERPLSVGARWTYNQGPQSFGAQGQPITGPSAAAPPVPLDAPPGGSQPWLRRAIGINPSLKAFVAAGLFDSLNSCAFNAHLVQQLEPGLARNITAMCYEGGHMMYDEPAVRVQVTKDVATFIQRTLADAKPRVSQD